jgi:hypothetical protein
VLVLVFAPARARKQLVGLFAWQVAVVVGFLSLQLVRRATPVVMFPWVLVVLEVLDLAVYAWHLAVPSAAVLAA